MSSKKEYTPVASTADRIREALTRKEMKPAELAKEAGLQKSAISRYLSGEYEPKQKAIGKMAVVLGVSEMWLWGYDVPVERTVAQQRNDDLVILIAKMRKDPEFFEVVSMLAELPADQYASVKSIIAALGKK